MPVSARTSPLPVPASKPERPTRRFPWRAAAGVLLLATIAFIAVRLLSDPDDGVRVRPDPHDLAGGASPASPAPGPLAAPTDTRAEAIKPTPFVEPESVPAEPEAVIAGRAFDSEEKPVFGARCVLLADDSTIPSQTVEGAVIAEVATDQQGRFRFDPARVVMGRRYVVQVSHDDLAGDRIPFVDPRSPRAARLEAVLQRGVAIKGMARLESGQPLGGVRVTLSDIDQMEAGPAGAFECEVRTDASGHYLIPHARPGVKRLIGRFPGYATTGRSALTVEDKKPLEFVDLVFTVGSTIAGFVAARDSGAPISGATVSARPAPRGVDPAVAAARARGERVAVDPPPRRNSTLTEIARTDEAGRFVIEGVDTGVYLVTAQAAGYRAPQERQADAGTQNLIINLEPRAAISGRVIDDVTGLPLARFEAGVVTSANATSIPGEARRVFVPPQTADGAFELLDLAPGRYWVLAMNPAYAGGRSAEITIAEGERRTGVEVRMVRGMDVTGRVVDHAGSPIAGSEVRLEQAGGGAAAGNPFLGMVSRATHFGAKVTRSGANGEFTFTGIFAGDFTLVAEHPDFASVRTPPFTVALRTNVRHPDLALEASAILRGTVRKKDGTPDARARLQLSPVGAGGASPLSATTDGDGRYVFRGIAPGRFQLVLTQRDGVVDIGWLGRAPDTAGGARTITLAAGDNPEIDF